METMNNSDQVLIALAVADLIKMQSDIFENSNGDDIGYDMKQVERLTLPMKILNENLITQLERYPEDITPEL